LEFLAKAVRQEQEMKVIEIQKENVKLFLFVGIVGKVAGCKINIQKLVTFLCTKINRLKRKSGKLSHLR
jgi:hypothetical protein